MDEIKTRRREASAQLSVLVGDWIEQVDLPQVPAGWMRSEWALDGQYLLQRSHIPEPRFPESLAIIAVAADGTGYTQHYFDSRGVVRTYAMSFDGRTWTLLRDRPDFTPLDFAQRFTGTFSDDGDTIAAAWERNDDGQDWRTDFTLTYTRIPATAGGQERTNPP